MGCYPETVCTHCGQRSNVQPPGNGCHTCGRGSMVEVKKEKS